MKKNNFASIETILNVAKKGGMFILVDDEKRENEGDLVISSSDSTAKNINFMAMYGRGLICLALDSLQAKKLNLSLMSPVNQSRNKTAFTISIEAKKGITTGISAKDRAKTIKIASKKNVNKKFKRINYIYNKDFQKKEMLHSMLLAMKKIDDDFICIYSDILFSYKILNKLILFKKDLKIKIPILKNWEKIWKYKDKSIYEDAEDLIFNHKTQMVKSIGQKIKKSKYG